MPNARASTRPISQYERTAFDTAIRISVGSGNATPMVSTRVSTCGTRYISKNKMAAPTTTRTSAG